MKKIVAYISHYSQARSRMTAMECTTYGRRHSIRSSNSFDFESSLIVRQTDLLGVATTLNAAEHYRPTPRLKCLC